jgi:hypothetical protein
VKKQAMTAFRELPGKFRTAQSPLPAAGVAGAVEGAAKPAVDAQRATELKKMLTEKVKAEPAAASRLVESWVKEEQR